MGEPEKVILKKGEQLIDRYGSSKDRFASPEGTPFEIRALPRTTDIKNNHVYVVLQDIEVLAGIAASWFEQIGGGVQYKLPDKIISLLGYSLKKMKK